MSSNNELLLHAAKLTGSADKIRELVSDGASVNDARDELAQTPLHWASFMGRTENAKALLDLGSDIFAVDAEGQTPLHRAVGQDQGPVVDLILEHCPSSDHEKLVNMVTAYGQSTLHVAVASFAPDSLVERLLDIGADPSAVDSKTKRSALMWAVHTPGRLSLVTLLASKLSASQVLAQTPAAPPDPSAPEFVDEERGFNALHFAAARGGDKSAALVKFLLSVNGELARQRDARGRFPLHVACAAPDQEDDECVDLLLTHDPEFINETDTKLAWKPLHYAAKFSRQPACLLLVKRGADVRYRDTQGKTAQDICPSARLRGKI